MFCFREISCIAIVLTVSLCRVDSAYVTDGLTPAAEGLNANNVLELADHHREKRSDNNGYLDRVSKYLSENLNVEFERLVNKTIGEVYNGNDKFGEFNG